MQDDKLYVKPKVLLVNLSALNAIIATSLRRLRLILEAFASFIITLKLTLFQTGENDSFTKPDHESGPPEWSCGCVRDLPEEEEKLFEGERKRQNHRHLHFRLDDFD